MASISLNSSASGMSALNTQLDVIANNIANAPTVGFKSSRANFQDLYYIEKRQPGVESQSTNAISPIGLFVGLGTEVSGTQLDFQQGTAIQTGKPLDVMIDGNGFLQVDTGDVGTGVGYTRAGQLSLDQEGNLVMANNIGYRIEPAIQVPENVTQVTISPEGIVFGQLPNQANPVELGQIEIATFQNPAGLETIGNNIYLETFGSGAPNTGNPGDPGIGAGFLRSGFTEGSNVDPVTQLVDLIRTQRTFEMNSQVFDAADETLQTVVNLGR